MAAPCFVLAPLCLCLRRFALCLLLLSALAAGSGGCNPSCLRALQVGFGIFNLGGQAMFVAADIMVGVMRFSFNGTEGVQFGVTRSSAAVDRIGSMSSLLLSCGCCRRGGRLHTAVCAGCLQ